MCELQLESQIRMYVKSVRFFLQEVFNCMLRNLFEEYKFFPQYPDKELHITAQLFGGIIEQGLVRYVLFTHLMLCDHNIILYFNCVLSVQFVCVSSAGTKLVG